jgi:hypothetical protein
MAATSRDLSSSLNSLQSPTKKTLERDNTEEKGGAAVAANLDFSAVRRGQTSWPPIGTVLGKATREEWEVALFAPENEGVNFRFLNFVNGRVIVPDTPGKLHDHVIGAFGCTFTPRLQALGLVGHIVNSRSLTTRRGEADDSWHPRTRLGPPLANDQYAIPMVRQISSFSLFFLFSFFRFINTDRPRSRTLTLMTVLRDPPWCLRWTAQT